MGFRSFSQLCINYPSAPVQLRRPAWSVPLWNDLSLPVAFNNRIELKRRWSSGLEGVPLPFYNCGIVSLKKKSSAVPLLSLSSSKWFDRECVRTRCSSVSHPQHAINTVVISTKNAITVLIRMFFNFFFLLKLLYHIALTVYSGCLFIRAGQAEHHHIKCIS